MKLNLECGTDLRNGYLNIHSVTVPLNENVTKDTQFVVGYYNQLEPILKGQKVEEIVFNPPMNIFSPENLIGILQYWQQFLTENGIIHIFFIDIRRVARATQLELIPIQETHQLLFGPDYMHKSVIDSNTFKAMVKAIGFDIDSMSIKDFFATFELKVNKNINANANTSTNTNTKN